jgi:ribonuclease HI
LTSGASRRGVRRQKIDSKKSAALCLLPARIPMKLTKKIESALRESLRLDGPESPKMSEALRMVGRQKTFLPAMAERLGVEPAVARNAFGRLADALDALEEVAPVKPAKDAAAPGEKTEKSAFKGPEISPAWAEPIVDARLFTDGCSKGNPGAAAGGIVFRTPEGETLLEAAVDFSDMTNNEAEYNAVIRGLEIAAGKGIKRLKVYSDSELVVKQITGAYRVKTPHLAPLVERVRQLRDSLPKCSFEAVPRSENARADELANYAISQRRKNRSGEN